MNVNFNGARSNNLRGEGLTGRRLHNEHSPANAARRSGRSIGSHMTQSPEQDQSIKIADSLLEAEKIQQDFTRRLAGDDRSGINSLRDIDAGINRFR
ncbi:MAG: hypothetical protein FWF79_04955 [Defluviitaleaceae bacterium]|nr:hypothetical protein [Defluviitaleaceae bacterium]